MEERRQKKQEEKSSSFDDLLNSDGSLKDKDVEAMTTAAEMKTSEDGLRRRNDGVKGAALGATFADLFADEMHTTFVHEEPPRQLPDSDTQTTRESSATLPAVSPSAPQLPQQRLLIDTEDSSNPTSGQPLDLTPTASTSSPTNLSQTSEHHPEHQRLRYWSVNEWAENTDCSSHSPLPERTPGDGVTGENKDGVDTEASDAGSEDDVGRFSHVSSEGDLDVLSEDEDGFSTPGSWTEVVSSVSGGD